MALLTNIQTPIRLRPVLIQSHGKYIVSVAHSVSLVVVVNSVLLKLIVSKPNSVGDYG